MSTEPDQEDDFLPPWEDVVAARANRRLQNRHSLAEAACYRTEAGPCPRCGRPPAELAWFYFRNSNYMWAHDCGRAGWITVCDACTRSVDLFLECMS